MLLPPQCHSPGIDYLYLRLLPLAKYHANLLWLITSLSCQGRLSDGLPMIKYFVATCFSCLTLDFGIQLLTLDTHPLRQN